MKERLKQAFRGRHEQRDPIKLWFYFFSLMILMATLALLIGMIGAEA